jgi:hypothetical protein
LEASPTGGAGFFPVEKEFFLSNYMNAKEQEGERGRTWWKYPAMGEEDGVGL